MRRMISLSSFRFFSLFCVLFAVCCLLPGISSAQVPALIRYQGQAIDSQGVPLEGPYTLTFRLYDAQTAGTKLWEEAQVNVQLTTGHFSVLLGQVTALTNIDWTNPCWISVQVGTDPELTPRQRITSVPLAIRAETAESLTNPTALRSSVASFSRTMAAGSGSQTIELPFMPTAVLVSCGTNSLGTGASWGFGDEDLGEESALFQDNAGSDIDTYYNQIVRLVEGTNAMTATYTTFDTSSGAPAGFTLLWAKTGNGLTANCVALGVR